MIIGPQHQPPNRNHVISHSGNERRYHSTRFSSSFLDKNWITLHVFRFDITVNVLKVEWLEVYKIFLDLFKSPISSYPKLPVTIITVSYYSDKFL